MPNARRWLQACLVCVLAVVMLGAEPSARFNKVGHEMICTCGCGQVLLECNHVGCPVSPVMISELHTLMDGGGSDTSILNWFAPASHQEPAPPIPPRLHPAVDKTQTACR